MKQQDLFSKAPAKTADEPSKPVAAAAPPAQNQVAAAPAPTREAVPVPAREAAPVPAREVAPVPTREAVPGVVPEVAAPREAPAAPRAAQVPTAAPEPLTVAELTRALKDALEPRFARVLVRGEVSGFRGPNVRGHLYFAIKDAAASVDVKMWQSAAGRLKFALKDGLSVVVEGYVQIYEPQGRYSIIASRLEPSGVGALALAFEQLKVRLLAEGLFGPRRTKPKVAPPFLPRRIGVATSLTGAALKDFLKVLHRRNPRAAVLVCDTRVQGEGAADDIARAVGWLGRTDVDVIVVTRGGGSAEDLWAFNEEPVVRAIFAARVPVVSAVGHEVDVTLSDLVADVRVPTPSAAAELLAPDRAEVELALAQLKVRLTRATERGILVSRRELEGLGASLGEPRRLLTQGRLTLSELASRMHRGMSRQLKSEAEALRGLSAALSQARPAAMLLATRQEVRQLEARLVRALSGRLVEERQGLSAQRLSLERHSPLPALREARQKLAGLGERLAPAGRRGVVRHRDTLAAQRAQLDALSPLKVLGRGYAIATRTADGKVVRARADVAVGDALELQLSGEETIGAKVTSR